MEGTITTQTDPANHAVLAGRYRLSDQVVIDRLGDSMVAVQLDTDKIFELNETAARLMELLGEGKTAAAAAAVIAAEYDATIEDVSHDVVLTVGTLLAESMIEAAANDF